MNIIICGAGRVGFTIAKLLTEQNHSITVIDQSSEDIQKINESLDVKAIVGKATSPEILDRANTADADMLIAVTRNDEINMLICQIAYSLFKVPKKIARIRSQEYLDPKFSKLFNKENLPIDYVISPELEIAKSLQRKLEAPGALDNVPFAENKIRLLEILIDEKCPIHETKLKELTNKFPNLNAYILGVIREESFKILKKDDKIDNLEKDIYALAYKIIAMRQPMANDLRTVVSALSIANDLERMGDHATNVAKRVANVKVSMPSQSISKIVQMGDDVQKMIKNVLDAFIKMSEKKALNVWDSDIDIDETYLEIYRELLQTMADNPDTINGCAHLLTIAKNIERIGDYAQNIAEDIHFIVTGETLERKSDNAGQWEDVDIKT